MIVSKEKKELAAIRQATNREESIQDKRELTKRWLKIGSCANLITA